MKSTEFNAFSRTKVSMVMVLTECSVSSSTIRAPGEGAEYDVIIYKDAEDAHWDDNPTAIYIEEIEVDSSSSLKIQLAEGGGFAISLLKR